MWTPKMDGEDCSRLEMDNYFNIIFTIINHILSIITILSLLDKPIGGLFKRSILTRLPEFFVFVVRIWVCHRR